MVESGENIENVRIKRRIMKDGVGMLAIKIQSIGYGSKTVRKKRKSRHESHIFVDDTFWEEEVMFHEEIAANEKSPGAETIANKGLLPVLTLRDGGFFYGTTIFVNFAGGEMDKIGMR